VLEEARTWFNELSISETYSTNDKKTEKSPSRQEETENEAEKRSMK
jgi:hypothetical protein